MVVSIRLSEYRSRSADLRPLLKTLGSMVVSMSQDAFQKQEWDGKAWPARYPGQSPPKVNIAGLVSDLAQGGSVKSRRFQDRPALKDTGALLASVVSSRANEPEEDRIEVGAGPEVPYAALHQEGGESKQRITKEVRRGLWRFLKQKRGDERRAFSKKLGWLFAFEELETTVVQRQFIGVTEQLEEDLARTVELYFATGRT